VNSKRKKTLAPIFARPTSPSIVFSGIESLIKALGGSVREREGSRIKLVLRGSRMALPSARMAKRYQVEDARELLERAGVKP